MTDEQIIRPEQIESQLSIIWDNLQGKGTMRSCLFNLIVYTKKNERVDYLYQVVKKLIGKFPSRIIFLTINDQTEEEILQTSVSVLTAGNTENAIACDLINIMLSKKTSVRAPFLILPHLLTDLPIYLLSAEDPAIHDPLVVSLEALATKVIFDSESSSDLAAFAKALLQHQEICFHDIADFNWARIEGWRHLITDMFSKEREEELYHIQEIKIGYNNLATPFFCHTKIQAFYLQGWLSFQLGWKLQSIQKNGSSTELFYLSGSKQIHVVLIPKEDSLVATGRVLSCDIYSDSDKHLGLQRDAKNTYVIHIERSTSSYCELPTQYIFDKYESGQSLVHEICHPGTSAHYKNLLYYLMSIPKGCLEA